MARLLLSLMTAAALAVAVLILGGERAQALSCVGPEAVLVGAEGAFIGDLEAREGDRLTLRVVERARGVSTSARSDGWRAPAGSWRAGASGHTGSPARPRSPFAWRAGVELAGGGEGVGPTRRVLRAGCAPAAGLR